MTEFDRWFPPRGQCQICGVPGMDARHRILDAISEHYAAGETPKEIARELAVPVKAVRAALRITA